MVGDLSRHDVKEAIATVQGRYLPRGVIATRDSGSSDVAATRSSHLDELFAGKASPDGQPMLYVCQNFACREPATGLEAIKATLDELEQ
jgi:uncharacterized protein YyaL (SSP411 family)